MRGAIPMSERALPQPPFFAFGKCLFAVLREEGGGPPTPYVRFCVSARCTRILNRVQTCTGVPTIGASYELVY